MANSEITSVQDAEKLLARDDADKVQSAMDFYYGNHWQDSKGWSGELPPQNNADYTTVKAAVERAFVSKNTTKEVVDRLVNSVVGRDFRYTLSFDVEGNKRTQKQVLKEAEAILKRWLKDKDAKKFVQKALRHGAISGKSTLRLFIPPGLLRNGQINVDPANPLQLLYVDAPTPLSGTVVEDPNTRERMGVFVGVTVDEDGREKKFADVSFLMPQENTEGRRFTEFVILPERGQAETAQLDLDGKLFLHQIEFPRLTTDQLISMQKFQNFSLTMMKKNAELGGFLERVILAGQMPGTYDEQGNFTPNGKFVTGPGTTNFINGIPTIDPDTGRITGYTQPSVSYRDPVSVRTFTESTREAYRGILEEAHQIHALLSGDAVTSGDSRRQALAEFVTSLRIPKTEAEKSIEWLLEAALMAAGAFSGNPDRFRGISVKAECKLDTGIVSSGEIDLIERMVRVGIISLETARERAGVEDLEEEARRVDEGMALVERANATFQGSNRLSGGVDNRDRVGQNDTVTGETS